jgi:hypothetical protein
VDENPIARFEDRDGVPGVNIFGREYPMEDLPSERYRTGYWRPLKPEELLIKEAAFRLGHSTSGWRDKELSEAVRTILRGFDEGVFVRSIDRDGEPGWAINLLPFIQALAAAQRALSEGDPTP